MNSSTAASPGRCMQAPTAVSKILKTEFADPTGGGNKTIHFDGFDIGFLIGSCAAGQQTPYLTSGFAGQRLQTACSLDSGQFFLWQFFGVHAIIFCGALLPWLLIVFFWVNIFVLTKLAGFKVRTGFKHFVLGLPGLDTVLNGNFGCSFFRLKIRFWVDNWPCDDQVWF